jgi:hypothetical protein
LTTTPESDRSIPAGPPEDEARPEGSDRRRLVAVVAVAAVVLIGVLVYQAVRPEGRPAPPPGSGTLVPYEGLGTWVDAYDWTDELGGPTPSVDLSDIDAMADAGIQTLFLQTSHRRSSAVVMEPERLEELIDRAHERGMHVVAWYLPTLVDVAADLERLLAATELGVDGLAVDIESTAITDHVARNAQLLDLSTRLREAKPDLVLGAITLSSVHVQVVNPSFWIDFPYAQLTDVYDVLLPMAYWSIRTGELRDGARYIGENIDRIRAAIDDPRFPIHPVGGIADGITADDLAGMLRAMDEREVVGASLYDWATSTPEQWELLGPVRDLRRR